MEQYILRSDQIVIRPLGAANQTQILQELFWKTKIAMDIIQHNLEASHPYFLNRRSDVPYPSVLVEIPRFGASTPGNPCQKGLLNDVGASLKNGLM